MLVLHIKLYLFQKLIKRKIFSQNTSQIFDSEPFSVDSFIINKENKMNQGQNESQAPNQQINNQFLGHKQEAETTKVDIMQQAPLNAISTKPEKTIHVKTKKQQAKKYVKGVQDNPQYFRVDYEITHKLYEIYRRLRIENGEQAQYSSFEEKQQGNNTINYHKIMQIFKDIGFKLQINQKLQILRAIKKFSFNQNFINEEQFIKIYKVIVHGIGIKQTIFKPLIASKYSTVVQKDARNINHKKAVSIKINKNFGKKIKTEASNMQSSQIKSQFTQILQDQRSIETVVSTNKSYLKKIPTLNPSTIIDQRQSQMHASVLNTARKHESRRRMITQANRYDAQKGYLNRAIEKNKLGKLTWQNLFKMTEENMHSYITIPSFVTQDININDLDL